MFNTMTVTKTVAALCGALLVFLLAGWAGRALYSTGPQEVAATHEATQEAAPAEAATPEATTGATTAADEGGTEAEAPAKAAPAEAAPAEVASAEGASNEGAAPAEAALADKAAAPADDELAAALAAADPAAGEKVFGKCKACHSLEDKNLTGPHLDGVVGRPIASIEGFKYSKAMIAHEGANWDPATLSEFLTSPKTFAPGTKMSFAGLPKVQDRANLIAFLESKK